MNRRQPVALRPGKGEASGPPSSRVSIRAQATPWPLRTRLPRLGGLGAQAGRAERWALTPGRDLMGTRAPPNLERAATGLCALHRIIQTFQHVSKVPRLRLSSLSHAAPRETPPFKRGDKARRRISGSSCYTQAGGGDVFAAKESSNPFPGLGTTTTTTTVCRAFVVLGSGRFSLGTRGASEGCGPPRGTVSHTPLRNPAPGLPRPTLASPKGPRRPSPDASSRAHAQRRDPARPAPSLPWPRRGPHPRPHPGAPTRGGCGGHGPKPPRLRVHFRQPGRRAGRGAGDFFFSL